MMSAGMNNTYSVRSIRETGWFGTKSFYVPEVYDPISGKYHMLTDCKMPTVWGYESEAEAWAVIDQQVERGLQTEEDCDYCLSSDCEDFHSDG